MTVFFLQKRGPQRSVDVIVSSSFYISSLFLAILSVELLKVNIIQIYIRSMNSKHVFLIAYFILLQDTFSLSSEFHLESSAWCMVLGIYLLRFLTLGTKINKKYRNLSTLITEQVCNVNLLCVFFFNFLQSCLNTFILVFYC